MPPRARPGSTTAPPCRRTSQSASDNLVLLCRRHHRLVHERGFKVAREGDDLVFRRPDGKLLEQCPAAPRSRTAALVKRNRRRLGPNSIGPDTCVPRFGGDKLDYDIAVEGLFQQRSRGP